MARTWEGKDYDIGISLIHLGTTETIMVRRGSSTVIVGKRHLDGNAGQTVVNPANTPHTFRTRGPQRYESIAIHSSPAFLSTSIIEDASVRR